MKVTHQDIATRAGFSRAIVTQALHHSRGVRVSPETRMQILKVAREMGYEPRTVTTHNIGLVFPENELGLPVTTKIFQLARSALKEHGFRVSLLSINPEDDIELIRRLINPKTVDGLIFTQWGETQLFNGIASSIPSVLMVDDPDLPLSFDQVSVDTVETASRATTYLIERGHRKILFWLGHPESGFHVRIMDGARQAYRAAGLPIEDAGSLTFIKLKPGLEELAHALPGLVRQHNYTAIVTTSPGLVVPLMNRVHEAGFHISRDLSLVSMVDSPDLYELLHPGITATTALGDNMVRTAVDCLLKRIYQPDVPRQCVLLPGEIIERDSVAVLDP